VSLRLREIVLKNSLESTLPEFIVSLDFELLWGVRDHKSRDDYGSNILGARIAIPRLLDLFEAFDVRATWATVGFLFCENKDELLDILPDIGLRPRYTNPALSNYSYLDEVGDDERKDPYYFAPTLIEQIAQTPGQEIGTHTLSHYYCLEEGQDEAMFEADLSAAVQLASRRGILLRSIVFPRNQYSQSYLDVCRRCGITTYRGNPSGWVYSPTIWADQTFLRRAIRLGDAYVGFLGHKVFPPDAADFRNVPASRFLRPCSGLFESFHPAHVRVIKTGMTRAARTGVGYHLWWHPHNFGRDLEANLEAMRNILDHFATLRDQYGMLSRPMAPEAIAQH
jgi:peptidoglycan/xylan/chitin deacetylase (PgdA/CDA1 family)